jgi:hypothetical protein
VQRVRSARCGSDRFELALRGEPTTTRQASPIVKTVGTVKIVKTVSVDVAVATVKPSRHRPTFRQLRYLLPGDA